MECIIYTQRVENVDSYQERRDCADQRIADFIYTCGYIPIPLPNRVDMLEDIIREVHPRGIVLTGGNSLLKYGGNAPERDAVDYHLLEIAIRENLPVYGFCRGMQSILDFFGSELVNVEGHVANRHMIIKNDESIEVNSFHNQGCIEIGSKSELRIMALSEDGVIEAVQHNFYPIWGNMWHPEREEIFNERDIRQLKLIMKREGKV